MIAYDLQCRDGHAFEGWFEDEKAYKSQKRKGLLACPICNCADVGRVPSTFAIKSSRGVKGAAAESPKIDLEQLNKKVVDFVESNFDNVGTDFAKEALKMHYGASEPRNIRGTSTDEEEKTLKEEGIDFFKFPVPERTDTDS